MKKLEAIFEYLQTNRSFQSPKLAIILGTGLSHFADQITISQTIAYEDIPHFPTSSVAGHPGHMIFGEIKGVPVVCLQGRIHFYEGNSAENLQLFIRILKLLGCEYLFLTNAAGGIRTDFTPGQLMLINDHINLQGTNPLIGPNDESFGSRFFAMSEAYDPQLLLIFQQAAQQMQLTLAEGVYLAVSGPSYETPAEIRAFRTLGADAVGMSTVPEVLVARHCGLKVAAVSVITNMAAGLSHDPITHEEALFFGQQATQQLTQLLTSVIGNLIYESSE